MMQLFKDIATLWKLFLEENSCSLALKRECLFFWNFQESKIGCGNLTFKEDFKIGF